MMITNLDIAWAAGIYEGEGSVGLGGPKRTAIYISIPQNEDWLAKKLQSLFGGSVMNPPSKPKQWIWTMHGANARGFLYTIYTFLSPRRREQIEFAINQSNPSKQRQKFCKYGHKFDLIPEKGPSVCKQCNRDRQLKYGRRVREETKVASILNKMYFNESIFTNVVTSPSQYDSKSEKSLNSIGWVPPKKK